MFDCFYVLWFLSFSCVKMFVVDLECIDCQVEWNDWGQCENGERRRSQYIAVDPVGAGKPCPLLDSQLTGKKSITKIIHYVTYDI